MPVSAREQAGGSGRAGCGTDGACRRLPAVCASGAATGSHPSPTRRAFSMYRSVGRMPRLLIRQAHRVSFSGQSSSAGHSTRQPILAKSPCARRPEPRSPTASSMALVGRGRLRLLPQRCSPKFLPLGCAHSSRNQETPVCPVLHCVAALRVQRCKPLPQTSHRGRE
jgi:hypothetical protein